MGELTIPHTVNQFLGQYVTGNVQYVTVTVKGFFFLKNYAFISECGYVHMNTDAC